MILSRCESAQPKRTNTWRQEKIATNDLSGHRVHILVCFFIIVVVLLQSGTSGDISAAFGGQGSQTAFGPRGAASALSKATTWSAVAFMITSITLSVYASQARRPDFRTGGREVAAGQDAARPGADRHHPLKEVESI